MKPLISTIWAAAVALLGWGCYVAFQADHTDSAFQAATQSRNAALRAAGPHSTANLTAQSSGFTRPASAPVEKWPAKVIDAEERKAIMANALPNSPESRALRENIRVRLRYHALYESLGLNPAQIARFEKGLLAKGTSIDPFISMVGPTPEEEARIRESTVKKLEQVVSETLGEAAVPKVREFVATADYRDVADKLAANTFFTDTPLTAAQADQLIQTCLANRTKPGALRNDPADVDWDQTLRQAGSFLSPSQLRALQAMTAIRRFDQEFLQSTGLPYRSPVRNF